MPVGTQNYKQFVLVPYYLKPHPINHPPEFQVM